MSWARNYYEMIYSNLAPGQCGKRSNIIRALPLFIYFALTWNRKRETCNIDNKLRRILPATFLQSRRRTSAVATSLTEYRSKEVAICSASSADSFRSRSVCPVWWRTALPVWCPHEFHRPGYSSPNLRSVIGSKRCNVLSFSFPVLSELLCALHTYSVYTVCIF